MPSVTKRRRRPGPRWIASTRMPFMLTAESLPRCQGIYPTILTERGLPAACTCRVVATGRVGADSARPGSSACRRRLPEQVACRRHWCPGPCRCPLLGWAGRDVGGKRPFPCCAADEVTSGGQFDPEVLECLACEVSFQVFFAFPQFGQNEPTRVVEVGGEAVENAAVLPVRRGRRPACKLGNVVVCIGRGVKDELYEDHEQWPFLAGCPVAVRPVVHSGVAFGWRTPGRAAGGVRVRADHRARCHRPRRASAASARRPGGTAPRHRGPPPAPPAGTCAARYRSPARSGHRHRGVLMPIDTSRTEIRQSGNVPGKAAHPLRGQARPTRTSDLLPSRSARSRTDC